MLIENRGDAFSPGSMKILEIEVRKYNCKECEVEENKTTETGLQTSAGFVPGYWNQ